MALAHAPLNHTPHTVRPLDDAVPTEDELRETEALKKFMQEKGLYETSAEFQLRVDVLQLLLELVPAWVKIVARHLGKAEMEVADADGSVLTYGSFRLSTHGPGDDIDTLCYGPQWCTRDRHFFGQEPYCFEEILRRHNAVSKVQAVPDAYVPVLKLEIKGIDIDLPYAQLPLTELPEELDLQDNNLLRGMDGASITSINGCRVTNKIVQLNTVNGEYREAFQDALRFLKYWAKNRGIYSNVMGFLGGVNFAILTTRVCLHFPRACASKVVRNFFKLFSSWDWANAVPVMVTGIDTGGPAGDMVWDLAISQHQGREIFPIITPCYPASNSTFNVSECTKGILLEEFERGKEIVAASPVIAAASSSEDFGKWSGYLNARVKHFVSRLHNTQGSLQARPWPKEFPIPMAYCEDGRQRTSWVIGVRKQAQAHNTAAKRIDIRATIADFKTKCEHWTGHTAGMTLEIKHLKFDSLPPYLAVHAQAAAERTVTTAAGAALVPAPEAGVEAADAGIRSEADVKTPPDVETGGSEVEGSGGGERQTHSASGSAASSPVGGKRKRDGATEGEGAQRQERIPQPHVEMAAT